MTPTGEDLSGVLTRSGPLYAVLDAARDDKVFELLAGCTDEKQSLYDEPAAKEWESVAPYLVRFKPGSPFLKSVLTAGWGKAWGIFLNSAAPFVDVRRQLRNFLFVMDGAEKVYFRFYDPRVLRQFLPTCTGDEYRNWFGPVSSFLVEGRDPGFLIRFRAGAGSVGADEIAVRLPAGDGIGRIGHVSPA